MKKAICLAIGLIVLFTGCRTLLGTERLRLYDLQTHRIFEGREALAPLLKARIVLVGEHHTDRWHHKAQLAVIEALHRSGRRVAIGLEMFRQENQSDLARWISGELQEPAFEPVFLDNWGFDWHIYRPIFLYAREQNIPMIGLNVPKGVSSQVAHHGFNSLSEDQRAGLKSITCDVTSDYREFIRRAYGAHAHGAIPFENFCEAQLLWDTAMAEHALAFSEAHPDTTLILLSGSGHAQKLGIPSQLRKRSTLPYVVLLPETPEMFTPENLTPAQADYLVLP